MAILLAVVADHSRRQSAVLARLELPVRSIPAGLALALIVSVSSYWGLHLAFYGPNGHVGSATVGVDGPAASCAKVRLLN